MESKKDIKSILIIGAAGGLAQIVSSLLEKHYPEASIHGIDSRKLPKNQKKTKMEFSRIRYTRGNFEKLFRNKQFDMVYHLARMSHAINPSGHKMEERLDLNIMGTGRIIDLSYKFKVKKLVILSTHHVYGALSDNPVFIEEEAPLRASIVHPELRDVTEMDQLAVSKMWQYQNEMKIIIARPCNIIGPTINNTITKYLTAPIAPRGADFNPMFQFIHEFDMANILVKALVHLDTGVYNIAPDDVISIKEARKLIGNTSIPVPLIALSPIAKVFKKLWSFPDYLLDYLMYSCIIDGSNLKKAMKTQNLFRFTTKEALELLKLD